MIPPKDYTNLFLDMNAYFASVEQQVQPQLRGKPIGITPYVGATGCIIAKSYEAKAFGVKTGTLVGEARKLCPQIIILEARPELYMFYHNQIVKVLKSFTPFLRVLSVDEYNIKLTGIDCTHNAALKLAQNIKKAILEEVGDYLFCSVGVGPNAWLAKVAGELKKPNGLVILTIKELPALYRSMDLLDLPGINIAMKKRLHGKKIKTPFDFYESSLFNLSRWFGHPGRVWFYRLRGYEIDEIATSTKSISAQHVLAPKYRNFSDARRVLVKLVSRCSTRLRAKNLWSSGVAVGINFVNGPYWAKNSATNLICDNTSIQRIALALYDQCCIKAVPIRISAVLFNLQKFQGEQISLFNKIQKSRDLSKVLDRINDKYGDETIYPASMFDTGDCAPKRISFGAPE